MKFHATIIPFPLLTSASIVIYFHHKSQRTFHLATNIHQRVEEEKLNDYYCYYDDDDDRTTTTTITAYNIDICVCM